MGFIKHGSLEAVAKRGLVKARLGAPGSVQEPLAADAEEDLAVKETEMCCIEWRAGRIKLRRIFLIDSKPTGSVRSPRLNLSVPFFLTTSDFDLIWCENEQSMDVRCGSSSRFICSSSAPLS